MPPLRPPPPGHTITDAMMGDDAAVPMSRRVPVLVALAGDQIGTTWVIDGRDALIGRDAECAIPLTDGRCSRAHARLKVLSPPGGGPDALIIEDLHSTNGTMLNDAPLVAPHVLRENDRVRIGATVLAFDYRDLREVEAHRTLEHLAAVDVLTGLHNRRSLDDALRREHERSLRTGRPWSTMMLDVDHFKRVNDTYGHPAGDRVLATIAAILRKQLRTADIPGRWGGEEFAVVLPETDIVAAEAVAERVREAIASEVIDGGEVGLVVTASIGVAQAAAGGRDPHEVLAAADEALYEAKREGRNRVRVGKPRSGVTRKG